MVAGVAYSSFAFKPLWHPPLVRNVSFAIQNTTPMESMKTLKFVFFLFTRQTSWKNIAARRAKHMRGAMTSMILWNFVSWCLGAYFLHKFCYTAECAPNCAQKGAPRERNEFDYKWA